jgi:hypothetical protein
MTEEEWLTSADPYELLGKWRRFDERKLVLFGCACCRCQWHLFTPEFCQEAVTAAEEYADGAISSTELRAARHSLESRYPDIFWSEVYPELKPQWAAWLATIDTIGVREFEAEHPLESAPFDDMLAVLKVELSGSVACALDPIPYEVGRAEHADLLRDIFGNPFRPVTLSPTWRTDTVLALARQMYDSRDFSTMPILADALQDAGCDNDAILAHCRDASAIHVRGCWVVDLVLGKE